MGLAIKVENLSKAYQLGQFSTGTISRDLERWWALMRGREDPFLRIGEKNDRANKGESDIVWSLRNLDFEIQQGEAVGIIGRNGAGKSTLLKLLSRVTSPSQGEIKIKGRVASLLEVGTGFHPELTGRENVFLNGAILGMRKSEIQKNFDEIIDFAGVERYIDTPVKRYSSGMYVRLAFAVAAHLEILMIDEVLAVGDSDFQKKCIGKMDEISAGHGRTILFVSHNMSLINSFCSKGILLRNGEMVFQGGFSKALDYYTSSFKTDISGYVEFDGNVLERFGEKKYTQLISLRLKNQNGDITSNFNMGDKMSIMIDADIKIPHDDYEIGIGIGTLQGVMVHYFVSGWEGVSKIEKTGQILVEIDIPNIYMFPGDYSVNVWFAVKGQYYDDAVHNALSFSVMEGIVNPHDTYFERFSKNTQVYMPTKWTLKQK